MNPLSANLTKWSNTLKQVFGNLPANCLSAFDHFVGLELKGLITKSCSFSERPLTRKSAKTYHLTVAHKQSITTTLAKNNFENRLKTRV